MPASKVTYERHAPGSFVVDLRVQRPKDPKRAQDIGNDFDETALGTLHAWRMDSGELILIDGQHRDEGAQLAGWKGMFYVKVLHGITLAEAAHLFKLLNNTRKLQPIHSYWVSLTAGEPAAVLLDKVTREAGVEINYGPGKYTAVASGLRIVSRREGVDSLRWAFEVSKNAFNSDPNKDFLNGSFIEALAAVRSRYGVKVEANKMELALAKLPKGVANVIGDARTYRSVKGGHAVTNLADAIVTIYNKGKREGKGALPEWRR